MTKRKNKNQIPQIFFLKRVDGRDGVNSFSFMVMNDVGLMIIFVYQTLSP